MAKREMPNRKTEPRRVTQRIKAAVDLIVYYAKKRDEAADELGIHRDTLRKAFKRPDVLAYLREQMGVLRTSASARSIERIDRLADESGSDHVKLQASELLLSLDGQGPVARAEMHHRHVHLAPGLTVNFIAAPEPRELPEPVIDITPRRVAPPGLPERVPHPSELKRENEQ